MSEFDYDRLIQVRASVIEDGEQKVKELTAQNKKLRECLEELVDRLDEVQTLESQLFRAREVLKGN